MIAVKAMYEQENIKYLDRAQEPWLEGLREIEESESMDEEDAQLLMSLHQELMPYRIEAEEAYLNREEALMRQKVLRASLPVKPLI